MAICRIQMYLLKLLIKFIDFLQESSLYSSLMKGLHALLPKKEEEKTLSIEDEKRQSPKPTKSSNNNEEIQFEMDIERINGNNLIFDDNNYF
jgi:hypothetical protein